MDNGTGERSSADRRSWATGLPGRVLTVAVHAVLPCGPERGVSPLPERFSRCAVTIMVMAVGPEVKRRRSLKCLNFDTNPGGKDSLNNKVHLTRGVYFAMWALIAADFLSPLIPGLECHGK